MPKVGGFTKVPNWLMLHAGVSVHAVAVYAALRSFADADDLVVYPSHKRIAQMAHCSVTTVKKAIKELEDLGALVVQNCFVNGERTSNRYHLVEGVPPGIVDAIRELQVERAASNVRREVPDLGHSTAMKKTAVKKTEVEEDPVSVGDGGYLVPQQSSVPREAELEQDFQEWFAVFPHEHRLDESRTRRVYKRARGKVGRGVLLSAVQAHVAAWEAQRRGDEFWPHPANWLYYERWEDDDW